MAKQLKAKPKSHIYRNKRPASTAKAEPRVRKLYGKYIVADSAICHGKLTFVGTRIFVWDVLDMVADGMDWDEVIRQWHGSITKEGIGEAVRLSARALFDHLDEYGADSVGL